MEESGLWDLLNAFLAAELPQMRRMLEGEAGEVLLSTDAEAVLRAAAAENTDAKAAEFFTWHADLLAQCRVEGVDEVFEAMAAAEDPQAMFAELQQLIASDASDPASLARQVVLAGRLLALIDRNDAPEIWAALQGTLGNALQSQGELTGDPALLAAAVNAYRDALTVRTRDATPPNWAATQNNLGNALQSQGELTGDPALLAAAVDAYRDALTVYTREATPPNWAATQNNLGNALRRRGELSGDPALLAAAVDAYRDALTVYTRDAAPPDWAGTQNNLGIALQKQGTLTGDPALLAAAVDAFRDALTVYTRDAAPPNWAGTQNNVGNALQSQGTLTGDPALLAAAVNAFRDALTVYTRDAAPPNWAMTQNNLGTALQSQGELTGDPALLAAAVDAFRDALTVRTRDATMIQNNLGNALQSQGTLTGDPALLAAAVDAYRDALTVYTRDAAPPNWAATQNNLGNALQKQGTLTGDPALLAAAVDAFRDALTVHTRDAAPPNWAATQNNLGVALQRQGELTGDPALLAAAVDAFRDALTVRTRDAAPPDWAGTQNNLGLALQRQGELTGDPALLAAAVDAYRDALTVHTRDAAPPDWAATQNNLGIALQSQGELTGDPALLAAAVNAFRDALTVHTRDAAPPNWAGTQNNLGIALQRQGTLTGVPALLAAAADAFRQALEVRDAARAPVDFLDTARALGQVLLRRQAWPEAVAVMTPLLAAGIALVLAEPTRQRQRTLLRRLSGLGDDLAAAHLALADPAAAGDALGRGRGIVLNLTAAAATQHNHPELAEARAAWRAAQAGADNAEERERAVGPDSLATAREAAAAARAAVHASYQCFRELLREAGLDQPEPIDAAALAAAIPSGGALVMPVIPSSGTGQVLILAAGSSVPVALPLPGLSAEWLDRQLTAWFAGYAAFRTSIGPEGQVSDRAIAAWNRAMADVLTDIGAILMAPIDHYLRVTLELAPAAAEIVLMLPGRLAALPLHAAPISRNGRIFLDHWITRQVANPRILLTAHRASARDDGPATLLGITNPEDNLGILRNPAADPSWFAEGHYADLVKADATLAAVKAQLPRHTHACFYCHGGWDPRTPELSGLRLADGILSVLELGELRSGISRMVMLAACESGLLDLNHIPDEFISPPVALNEAGIPSVVASLWPVPTQPTHAMVQGIFRRHIAERLTPAAALRETQLALRGAGWRFPIGEHVLGFGTPTRASDPDLPIQLPGAPPPGPAPDLFSWASFACFGA